MTQIKNISIHKESALGQCCLKDPLPPPPLKATTLSGVWSKLPSTCIYVLEGTHATVAIFQNNLEAGTEVVGNVWGTITEGVDWWKCLEYDCAPHENQLSRTCVIWAITCPGLDHLHSDGAEGPVQRTAHFTIPLLRCEGLCVNHLYTLHKYS